MRARAVRRRDRHEGHLGEERRRVPLHVGESVDLGPSRRVLHAFEIEGVRRDAANPAPR